MPKEIPLGTGPLKKEHINKIKELMEYSSKSPQEAKIIAEDIKKIIESSGDKIREYRLHWKGPHFLHPSQTFQLQRGGEKIAETAAFNPESKNFEYYICLGRMLRNIGLMLTNKGNAYYRDATKKGFDKIWRGNGIA